MGPQDMGQWMAQVRDLDNPLRRELHLLILLSGSRPDPIKKIKPEHIDFRKRVILIPEPKGGEAKAFCIPLSRELMRCVVRAMRIGRVMYPDQSKDWLFPSDSANGHIVEHKEGRARLSHWGNDLRQTYRTIGQAVGINEIDMHLLMNHSLPGVNAGYITRMKLHGHLRGVQQQLSDVIFEEARVRVGPTMAWPRAVGRDWISHAFPVHGSEERIS